MKNYILFLFILFTGHAFATPGIHEALKNPSAITVLKFSGEKDEASLFMKNASRFTALTQVQLTGISDSLLAEQDIAAIAACPSVTKISFDKCGFAHLSYAIKMLVSVKEVEISGCPKLNVDDAFTCLSGMPSLKSISYSTAQLTRIPKTFQLVRGLDRISISNTDLALADGYALNTQGANSLFTSEKLQLGFGTSVLLLEYSCYDKKSAKEHISIMRDMLQGVACLNGEMILPQKPAAFTRQHPFVKPPFVGLDVRKNTYSTSAVSGGKIEYPSGTQIFIPDHAFVDANGNEVKGEVTIDYREFRNPVDILVSGITMVYDTGGQKTNFESAGMFELNASVNGKEVFLAPGKKVNMNFAVVDTASSYNFYRLDEKNGWEYLGKPGDAVKAESKNAINDMGAVEMYNKQLSYRRVDRNMYDSISFADRYADTNYIHMHKKVSSVFVRKVKPKRYSTISFTKTYGGKDFTVVEISFSRHQHPELSAFSRTQWMINKKMSAAQVRKLYGPKRGLHDIRLEYDGDAGFTIELKDLHGFEQLAVTPVSIVNGKPVAYKARECKWRYKSYSKQLKGRGKRLASEIKRDEKHYLQAKAKVPKDDSMAVWQAVRNYMTPTEQQLSFVEWKQFVRGKLTTLKNEVNALASNTADMLRSLTLDGFGVYNCDQIQRLENPVQIFAACMNESGNKQALSTIYIIDNHTNGVLTYSGGYDMKKTTYGIEIAFSPQYQTSMLAVGADGQMYIAGPAEFTRGSFESGRDHTFNVVTAGEGQTIGQLREMLMPQPENK